MKKKYCIKAGMILLIIFSGIIASAQEKYWVFFTDKDGVSFDPMAYFDAKAIARRIKNNIEIDDISDYPVKEKYIQGVENSVKAVLQTSRWFNAVAVLASSEQIFQVESLPFVKKISLIHSITEVCFLEESDSLLNQSKKEFVNSQIERMGASFFTKEKINGKGIRIAVFDIGFKKVDTHPAFEHIRKNNRIIDTWDFVKNRKNVYVYKSHGTMVMSCIGGMVENIKIGLATEAEFLLARTESNSEFFSEEENWLAAAEWADKKGADIINSSLGYTYHRYFNHQMDGKTSLVSKAARMAARKGILIVNSAGNSGSDSWHCIATPADVDSVLTVGGISPTKDYHIGFSSYGPTSDFRMKPNVCAFGRVIAASKNKLSYVDGTSFSSPLVAGFAACAWQMKDQLNNMELFKEIEKSGDLYPYFDYAHGYGVPQASYFVRKKNEEQLATFDFVEQDSVLHIQLRPEFVVEMEGSNNIFYYNIMNADGVITKYALLSAESKDILSIDLNHLPDNSIINVFYKKYHQTYQVHKG